MQETIRIVRKEFAEFFASPAALLFLGAFLVVTLFLFFWMETFFARNIADARPLFKWLPALLIFLAATLTMRSWSEDRRAGTIEILLVSPVSRVHLVLGKFLAGLGLVALALALTLPLPLTVSLLGPLDWGPVVGGYLAALCLAAAYLSIGVYMSARTDNPVVAWILTALVCGVFYLIGTPTITGLFGHRVGELLMLIGSGSRFDSVTRGVLDLRDLYFYLSIVGVFLTLNLFSLERISWAGNPTTRHHARWWCAVILVIANFIAANFWLQTIGWARLDITRDQVYSLSEATDRYLGQLQEPLLIRGYFSAKTHPLLSPLVPRLRDLLAEYAAVGRGRVRVELVDPHADQTIEEEAARKYGIRPIPFQMASRHESGVVNSYFHIVVSYGDQNETLDFQDLIEVKSSSSGDLDIVLKDPEYAITSTVKKVLASFRAGGSPFDTLTGKVSFRGYISARDKLPPELLELRSDLESVLAELQTQSAGRFSVTITDPEADGGRLGREINERYGFRPQLAGLDDRSAFWFSMLMLRSGEAIQVPLPEELGKEAARRTLIASLKRLAPGFLKTVALVIPSPELASSDYQYLGDALMQNNRVTNTDLSSGRVPEDADLLLVLAPTEFDERQVFAVDQFLMQGGSVFLATSTRDVQVAGSFQVKAHRSGLEDWLAHHGLEVGSGMVMDPVNTALPVPVERYVGTVPVREIQHLPYPLFPDLREDQLNADNLITSGLDQLTVNWISPVSINTAASGGSRKSAVLLQSSDQSWVSRDASVVPDYKEFPGEGFAVSGDRAARTLAIAVEGGFNSYFKDKPSPLLAAARPTPSAEASAVDAKNSAGGQSSGSLLATSVIEKSPPSARIILVGSNAFATDTVLTMVSEGMGTLYTKPLEFMQNVIDWSLEDQGLLSIRGRSRFSQTLVPLQPDEQALWEYLNYGLALAALLGTWLWRRRSQRVSLARYQAMLELR